MRKAYLILFLLAVAFIPASAQMAISGTIRDTVQNRPLSNAVITLLNKKDSTLAGFTRSNKEGKFTLKPLPSGSYVYLITYPKMADFSDEVELKGADVNLGQIALTPKNILLNEVIIRTAAAIRIKGDTTEFTADSFYVKEGATVEDLLKKLPGFQVNAKGQITAQGKRVEKVLVDGEEFFGDDPTMATQNLSAKIVDKVQLYDTRTEQQNLTGITSGTEGKTLNIKLKEDKKKGGFGKLIAASDFDRLMDSKALYNRFVGKKKVSVYGTRSDISTGSLNWDDQRKLGIIEDREYDEIGGYIYSFVSGDDFDNWTLRGLPHSYTAGGMVGNKWNGDKQNVNLSYRFNRLATDNYATRLSQINLKNATDYRNTYSYTKGLNQQHAVNGKYEWKIDSLISIKIIAAGLRKTTDQFAETTTEYLSGEELVNNSKQERAMQGQKKQWDNLLTYRQAFKKKNRLLLATFRMGLIDDEQNRTAKTVQNFYKANSLDSVSLLDQFRITEGNSQTFGGKITFNEPISTKWNLVLDYAHNRNSSYSYQSTFNRSSNGKYESLDPLFSNNFDLDVLSNSGNAIMRYLDKKLRFSMGSGLSAVNLHATNLDRKKDTAYHFLNVTPQVQMDYTIKPQTGIFISYRGTTRQPSIIQLQPVRDNTDPLNEFVGNPDLKVGFVNSFTIRFNKFKTLKQQYFILSSNFSITQNAIVNSVVIDPVSKKQSYFPVNTGGINSWGVWANWDKTGGPKKLSYGARLTANGGRNINFLNYEKNIIDYGNIILSFSASYAVPEKWSLEARPRIAYNSSSYSHKNAVDNNYFNYGGYLEGFVMLPCKIELRTDWNFDMRQRIQAFATNVNIIQWNGSIGKRLSKKESGLISLVANDILNQNRGFNRDINGITVTEDRYSRLSRYFLLRFEWSLTKMPTAN